MNSYLDESLTLEQRIDALISQLTVPEKVSQLTDSAAALSRLGINRYNWWNEALHGVARAGEATVFPQAIGLAAMWNDELLLRIAQAISDEARAKFNRAQNENNFERYYGLTFWSPNVNIFRDPRWGRGQETYGEDPYLTSRLGVAFVRGLQQGDGKHLKSAACAKHFAVHSGPEGTRHGYNAQPTQKDLFETYLPAFEALVREGEVEAVMGAYNALDGTPCCCNSDLLNGILREKWGFGGHVVSDCGAIFDIAESHKYVDSLTQAAAAALTGGCDLNCGNVYEHLVDAYEQDLIAESDLDTALRRTLRARFKLGMFDGGTSYDSIPFSTVACKEHKELCLLAAQESLVLLKNDGLLPLDAHSIGTVAIIGPNSDNREALLGNYNGLPTEYSTVFKGFCDYLGEEHVRCARGCSFFGDDSDELLNNAVSAAAECDAAVVCLGLDASFEGEQGDANNPYCAGDRLEIELPPVQLRLLRKVCEVNRNVIAVCMSGGAFSLTPADKCARAVIQAWYPGEAGGAALARAVFGEFSPSGRLPVTMYASTADLPCFDDYSMAGRTYRYFEGTPEYPFGYGLSYSKFEYSPLTLTGSVRNGVRANVTLKNTGGFNAAETVQLYVAENDCRGLPLRSLRGFKKVFLKTGESVEVSFDLTRRDFEHINDRGERELTQNAVFTVFVGGSQPDSKSSALLGAAPVSADIC